MITAFNRHKQDWMVPLDIQEAQLNTVLWTASCGGPFEAVTVSSMDAFRGELSANTQPKKRAWQILRKVAGKSWDIAFVYNDSRVLGLLAAARYLFKEEVLAVEYNSLQGSHCIMYVVEGTKSLVVGTAGQRIREIERQLGLAIGIKEIPFEWDRRILKLENVWRQEIQMSGVIHNRPIEFGRWATPSAWKTNVQKIAPPPLFSADFSKNSWRMNGISIDHAGRINTVEIPLLQGVMDVISVQELTPDWPEEFKRELRAHDQILRGEPITTTRLVKGWVFLKSGMIQLRLDDNDWVTPPYLDVYLRKVGGQPFSIEIACSLEDSGYEAGPTFQNVIILDQLHLPFPAVWHYYELEHNAQA